jgi:protein-tyrosine phosphatase
MPLHAARGFAYAEAAPNHGDLMAETFQQWRSLPIKGAHNLRDMGGYTTPDGRRLKWRTLYRSGVMAKLSEADTQALRDLGITAICDLRTRHERRRRPTLWHEGTDIIYYSRDYELSAGDLDATLQSGTIEHDVMEKIIHQVYRRLPTEQAESYRAMFQLLLEGRVPLLFNCTAGKDRTGLAAALLLHALGMDRAVIDEDYALTELVVGELERVLLGDPRYSKLAQARRADYLPLLSARPEYLTVAFAEIENQYGSMEAYFQEALGMGAAEIEKLKGILLEQESTRFFQP